MIRLKWNPHDAGARGEAVEASRLYMKAGMIPYVGGERKALVHGEEGEAEFRFRPTASARLLGDFLEDEDDGQAERVG